MRLAAASRRSAPRLAIRILLNIGHSAVRSLGAARAGSMRLAAAGPAAPTADGYRRNKPGRVARATRRAALNESVVMRRALKKQN